MMVVKRVCRLSLLLLAYTIKGRNIIAKGQEKKKDVKKKGKTLKEKRAAKREKKK